MADITSLAQTIAGTRAVPPKMSFPVGRRGYGGRMPIDHKEGYGQIGEAIGLIGAALYGKKLKEKRKIEETERTFILNSLIEGWTGDKEDFHEDFGLLWKGDRKKSDRNFKLFSRQFGVTDDKLLVIPPKEQREQRQQTVGRLRGEEQVAEERAPAERERERLAILSKAGAEEEALQTTFSGRRERARLTQEDISNIIKDREESLKLLDEEIRKREEQRLQKDPRYLADLKRLEIAEQKTRYELNQLKQTDSSYQEYTENVNKALKEVRKLKNIETDEAGNIKINLKDYDTKYQIDSIFRAGNVVPQFDRERIPWAGDKWVLRVQPYTGQRLVTPAKKESVKKVVLTDEQQKTFDALKKEIPDLTEEEFLEELELSGGLRETKKEITPATKPITTKKTTDVRTAINQIGKVIRARNPDLSNKEVAQQAKEAYERYTKGGKEIKIPVKEIIEKAFKQPAGVKALQEKRKEAVIDYYSLIK